MGVIGAAVMVIAIAAPAGAARAAAPSLAVSGNRLVDTTTGARFVPRGVNWPSFEYACFHGYAYGNEPGPQSVGPTTAQAALMASWRINTVRVPLNQDCWLGDDGIPKGGLTATGYRDAVAAWVATLHDAGLVVVLDLHWSGPDGVPADGQRLMADDRSDDFWTSVASRFKDDRAVLFDAFNEPYTRYFDDGPTFELTWDCWRDGGCDAPRVNDRTSTYDGTTFTTLGMQALVAAIRATGARQPILVAGRDYANDLGEWLARRPDDDQLVASFHNYNAQRCNTTACWDAEIAPIAAQVPVVMTEFGETDCRDTHVKSAMDWADARGVGYLMWQWVVLQPDELADPPCASLVVISDVNGTPAAPNGTALKTQLAKAPPPPPPPPPPAGAPAPPPPAAAPPPDRAAPALSKLSLSRPRGGVRLALTLDEPATVRLSLRRKSGRTYRTVRALQRRLKRGRTTVTVTSKRPRAGRYRLVVTATDATGNRSASRTIAFRVR